MRSLHKLLFTNSYVIKRNNILHFYCDNFNKADIQIKIMYGPRVCSSYMAMQEKVDFDALDLITNITCIDFDTKTLYLYDIPEIDEPSVVEYYFEKLKQNWEGWQLEHTTPKKFIAFLKELGYNYHFYDEDDDFFTSEDMKADIEEAFEKLCEDEGDDPELPIGMVILKENNRKSIKLFQEISDYRILECGKGILNVLRDKPDMEPIHESQLSEDTGVLIDIDNKKIITSYEIEYGVGFLHKKWSGWEIECEEIGYFKLLEKCGIDGKKYRLSPEEVHKKIEKALFEVDALFN